MIFLRLNTVLVFLVLACQSVSAQTLPTCRSAASDADGDGYGWENNASCLITNTSLTNPAFTNRETGTEVNLIRARWQPADFTDNDVLCAEYKFNGTSYEHARRSTLYTHEPLSSVAPFQGNVIINQGTSDSNTWTLDNGIYYGPAELAATPWLEVVDIPRPEALSPDIAVHARNGVRIWRTDDAFTRCSLTNPYAAFIPTGGPEQNTNTAPDSISDINCDYTSAANFGGWGWNPVTRQSCPPLTGEQSTADAEPGNCDYVNAHLFEGWGWDPVARQSCPPQNDEPTNARFPNCSAAFLDSDGDGYGWENEATCVVATTSTQAPAFINQETNQPVELTRAYWDGNTDIANRTIQCYWHSYHTDQHRYARVFGRINSYSDPIYTEYQIKHQAIPTQPPHNGWISEILIWGDTGIFSASTVEAPVWTVEDGRYIGPTMLQTPYVEIVTLENGARGIRHWLNNGDETALDLRHISNRVSADDSGYSTGDGYYECSDASGRDLEPTGMAGVATSNPATLSDLTFYAETSPFQSSPESIVDLETGNPVELTRALWNYNNDIAHQDIFCEDYAYFDPTPGDQGGYGSLAVQGSYQFPYHFTNSGSQIYFWEEYESDALSMRIQNSIATAGTADSLFMQGSIFTSEYVELISGGVRFWNSSESFSECTGITPTGSIELTENNNRCDYSNADQYNGWGWNPVTQQSCAPR